MNVAGVVAAVVVGATFLVAGASKVALGPRWTVMARDLGAPAAAIPLVPWVELAIGAALVAQLAVPVPAIAALALLVAFTALIGFRLTGDERPTCACFGAWSAEPIGARHLVRNAVLIVLAVVALFA